jgi:methyl-accepting chemotaxis protein
VVDAVGAVAGGNFNALPSADLFSGEMLQLHTSLSTMVGNLAGLVRTAESKTAEAEAQTSKANEAVQEAEEARKKSENAKREGMFHAAEQLKEIVLQTRKAAEDLRHHTDRAASGATAQSRHAAEAEQATVKMNEAVRKVAGNSTSAFDTAGRHHRQGRTRSGKGTRGQRSYH